MASDVEFLREDVRSKLAATGRFAQVDNIDLFTQTPSLATLQTYDAVLVWSNNLFQDRVTFGNNLADYIDGGGGVVLAIFSTAGIGGSNPGGRFESEGYGLITFGESQGNTLATLGIVALPTDPLMASVSSFSGGTFSYRPQVAATLKSGATLVASWSDGAPLVVKQTFGGRERVDLGFYPPSSDAVSNFWTASTDGTALMANALVVASSPVVPVPTLSEWALILLGLLLAGGAVIQVQRRLGT